MALLLALNLAACTEHRTLEPRLPLPPWPPPGTVEGSGIGGQVYVLAPGDRLPLPDSNVVVTFHQVTQDSRCPANAICVWQGDAALLMSVAIGRGPTVPFTLHTDLAPRDTTVAWFRIALTSLDPYPLSTDSIPADAYRATFLVSILPD